jgi:hypothetical protein
MKGRKRRQEESEEEEEERVLECEEKVYNPIEKLAVKFK